MPWEEAVNTGRQSRTINLIDPLNEPAFERKVVDEESFRRVIAIERKRTERSKAPFVLMLLEVANENADKAAPALQSVMSVLLASSRDTDVVGWYKSKTTIGALFTGLIAGDKSSILMTILSRATNTLRDELSFEQFNLINISLHYYPDDWDENGPGRPSNPALYPDLSKQANGKLAAPRSEAHHRYCRRSDSFAYLPAVLLVDCHRDQGHFERSRSVSPDARGAARKAIRIPEIPFDVCGQRPQRSP